MGAEAVSLDDEIATFQQSIPIAPPKGITWLGSPTFGAGLTLFVAWKSSEIEEIVAALVTEATAWETWKVLLQEPPPQSAQWQARNGEADQIQHKPIYDKPAQSYLRQQADQR